MQIEVNSVITCPHCSHQASERMPAGFSTSARGVAKDLNQSRVIVACSALTDRCRAHRFNKISPAVLEGAPSEWTTFKDEHGDGSNPIADRIFAGTVLGKALE